MRPLRQRALTAIARPGQLVIPNRPGSEVRLVVGSAAFSFGYKAGSFGSVLPDRWGGDELTELSADNTTGDVVVAFGGARPSPSLRLAYYDKTADRMRSFAATWSGSTYTANDVPFSVEMALRFQEQFVVWVAETQ